MLDELLRIFGTEEDRQAVSLLINWFRQLAVHGRIESADFGKVEETYRSFEEARSMLITSIEREKEEVRQEGHKEGRKEIVRNMQTKGYDLETIADVTGLSLSEVQSLLNDEPGSNKNNSTTAAGTQDPGVTDVGDSSDDTID